MMDMIGMTQVEECSFCDGCNVRIKGEGGVKYHSQVSGGGRCFYLICTNMYAGRWRLGAMIGVKAKEFSFAIIEFQSV